MCTVIVFFYLSVFMNIIRMVRIHCPVADCVQTVWIQIFITSTVEVGVQACMCAVEADCANVIV